MEKAVVLILVGVCVVISTWFAYLSLTEPGLMVNTYATLSVAILIGALVAIKAYEVYKR